MPTKTELQAELVVLRAELAALQEARAHRAGTGDGDDQQSPAHQAEENQTNGKTSDEAPADLEQGLRDIAAELEAVAEKNPAIALIGVFVAGIILGRLMAR